jgi:CRP/FNR family cyclic AMP-dependent transcriptional regulator
MYPIASEKTFKDGQIIFKEGSSGDWIYVILTGSMEIYRTIEGRQFILAVLESGEVFGELAYLGAIKRTATALAIGETTLGVIDPTFLDKEFDKLPGYFRNILLNMASRFSTQIERPCESSARRDARALKTLSVKFKNRHSFVRAYTGNISRGGLFIRTERPLKQGERFLLKLQLPDIPEPLTINCEVVWAREQGKFEKRPPGMGVMFHEMRRQDSHLLNQYINALLKDEETLL